MKRTWAMGRSLKAQQDEYGLGSVCNTLTVECPKCGARKDEWCLTKSGLVCFSPHAVRRDAVKFVVDIPCPSAETGIDDPELKRIEFRKGQVNKLLLKVKRRDAAIRRMVVKLREHYTDEYILWELIVGEREGE